MSCEEFEDAYELHALGCLEEPVRAELLEHLGRGCPNCVPRYRQALGMVATLAVLEGAPAPPARLRGRILASVGVPAPADWRAGLRWWPLAAGLALGLAWTTVQLQRERREMREMRGQLAAGQAEIAAARQALELLREPDTRAITFGQSAAQPPRGQVLINPGRGIVLIARNLPPVGADQTYQMWVVPKAGAPRTAGLFRPDAQGNAVYAQTGPVNVAEVGAVAVSRERAGGAQAPTQVVFAAPL